MSTYLSAIISFLAAFQLLFVALYLFSHQRGNRQNNALLGIIFLLFAISMADVTIRLMGIELQLPALHLIDDGFLFLYGPLLYFYTKKVVYNDYLFKIKHLLHLIPFLLFTAFLTIDIFSLSEVDQEEAMLQTKVANISLWVTFVSILIYLYLLSYLWFSNQSINTYRGVIKDKFSSIDNINLNWLKFIIRSFTIITIIAMINGVLPIFGIAIFQYISLVALLVFTFLFINRVLIKAMNQPEIFSGISMKDLEKYAGSNINSDEIERYKLQLLELLKKEKCYLNPELTLQGLADQLQISSKVLSQVINQCFNQKFYDLINSYRCEEVKEILSGDDHRITISEAMYQSGFNSKSSFNKEFKKLTGQTPSEFRKSTGK
jgi:AraC-like DNA-binding protein